MGQTYLHCDSWRLNLRQFWTSKESILESCVRGSSCVCEPTFSRLIVLALDRLTPFFFPLYTFSLPIFCIIRTAQFEPARSELTSRSPTCECGHFSFVSNRAIRGPVFQSTFHTWSYLYESMVAVGRTQVSLYPRLVPLPSLWKRDKIFSVQVSDGPVRV